jgi:protein O-GlcNAc transferase
LTTMNLQELITTNYENYEKLAIKISSDPDYLKNIKEKIKKNKLETNLFKSKVFTKNLENGYIKVFQNYIEGNKTKNFEL